MIEDEMDYDEEINIDGDHSNVIINEDTEDLGQLKNQL